MLFGIIKIMNINLDNLKNLLIITKEFAGKLEN